MAAVTPPPYPTHQAVLAAALVQARATIRSTNQWAWGNALEKAAEELRAEPEVEVEVDPELALIYPPRERIGVTYRATATTCQCEAFTDPAGRRPCRHRAKVRLVELCNAATASAAAHEQA